MDGEYRRPPPTVDSEKIATKEEDENGVVDMDTTVDGEWSEEVLRRQQHQQQQHSQEDIGKLSFIDPPTGKTKDGYVRSLTGSQLALRMETTIDDAGLIESCYFVPETANGK